MLFKYFFFFVTIKITVTEQFQTSIIFNLQAETIKLRKMLRPCQDNIDTRGKINIRLPKNKYLVNNWCIELV